ncbi:MAG: hypothetical protein NC102_04125 [Clostridium sp.]|nr:hypothetical protein [Clostridium sp.]
MRKILLLIAAILTGGCMMAQGEVQLMGCAYGSKIQGRKSGIYKISTTQPEMTILSDKPQATGGGTYAKGHYYCQWYMSMLGMEVWSNFDYNTETWEFEGGVGGRDTWAYDLAYDLTTDRIYGCFHDPDENYEGARLVFGWITPENYIKDYSVVENICDVFVNMAGMDFDSKGQLWAISREGLLMKINKETGDIETISNTGLSGYYNTSAAIDKATDTMYYFLQLKGGESEGVTEDTTTLYKIDLATYSVEKIYDLPGVEAIQGLAIFEPEASDTAPDKALNVDHSFVGGSLEGKISFTVPTNTYGGGELSGTVGYEVLYRPYAEAEAEYVLLASGQGECGQKVEAAVNLPGNGQFTFAVILSNGKGEKSPKALTDTYVGYDMPLSPSSVAAELDGQNVRITWEAPQKSVNNGYVDYDNLKYDIVRFPDETVVASGVSGLEAFDPVSDIEGRVRFTYKVYADNHGVKSAAQESNTVGVGSYKAPYACNFEDKAEFDEFTILTKLANPTHVYHWEYHTGLKAAKLSNSTAANDDWLITPAIYLEKGAAYDVTIEIGNDDDRYPALYRVCAGTSPTREGIEIHKLVEDGSVKSKNPKFETVKTSFTAQSDGAHHIGIHGTTAAREYTATYVYSIKVEAQDKAGAASIDADAQDGPVEYYSIDGRKLNESEACGLVIVRRGGKVTKEVIR